MRYIQVDLPPYYQNIVNTGYAKYPGVHKVSKEVFEDTMVTIAMGKDAVFRHMISLDDLEQGVMDKVAQGLVKKNVKEATFEEFKRREDLIEFATSDVVKEFQENRLLTIEEKFELCLMIFEAILDQNPAAAGSGGQGSGILFKGFSFMLSRLLPSMGPQQGTQGNSQSQGSGKGTDEHSLIKQALSDKLIVQELVREMLRNDAHYIFDLARTIDHTFTKSKKGKKVETDAISSNVRIQKMKNMKDITKAVSSEMLDEDSLERKIMNKTLRVKKYARREMEKQCLYMLGDRSGSTEGARINYIKSLAITLGQKALKEKSLFFFRWFESGVSSLFELRHASQWNVFLDFILNTSAGGGTSLDSALYTAVKDINQTSVQDIDKSEIILVTDGTEDISEVSLKEMLIERNTKKKKFHFVYLESTPNNVNSSRLAETFSFLDTQDIKDPAKAKLNFRNII